MSDEKNSFEADKAGKVAGNRGLLLVITRVAVLYLFLWAIYFAVFHDVRLMRGSSPDDWQHIFIALPIWMGAAIRYGLVVPLICAIIFGAITSREILRRGFLSLLLLIAMFCAISTVFEIAFEQRPVALWKFYLLTFPVLSIFGASVGRAFRNFIFSSK